jgi:hypothetical protein
MEYKLVDLDTGYIESPLVVIIEDPTSETVQEMVRIYQRIEARSKLVTNVDESYKQS